MIRIPYYLLIISVSLSLMIPLVSCGDSPQDSGSVDRYNRGVAYLESGEYKNAITEFDAALRADPSNFEARKNLAGAHLEEGNWEQARDNYLKARDLKPTDPAIYANLALVYQRLGEIGKAWENIESALEQDPGYPLAHYRAGELFMAQGSDEEALAAFGDCITLEPDSRLAIEAQTLVERITSPYEPEEIGDEGVEEEEIEEEEVVDEEEEVEEDQEEEEIVDEEEEEIVEEQDEEESEVEDELEDGDEEDEIVNGDEEVVDEETTDDENGAEEDTEGEDEEEEEIEPDPVLPDLEGDELYQDRLSRGRQMRAIGSTSAAIRLLEEAFDVHPDYAQVNYELGLAYLLDGQTVQGRYYLERYLELETDPVMIAEVEARLRAIEGNSDTTSEEPDSSTEDEEEEESEEDEAEEEENTEDESEEEENTEDDSNENGSSEDEGDEVDTHNFF